MDTQVFEIVFGAMIDLDMGDQYAVTDGKSSFALRRVQMPDQSERWLAQAFLVSPDDVFPVDGTVMNYTSEDCVAPLKISTRKQAPNITTSSSRHQHPGRRSQI